jgi:hypothetical protein
MGERVFDYVKMERVSEPLDNMNVWEDSMVRTVYWDNPDFQKVYAPGRDIAIITFRDYLSVAFGEDGLSHHARFSQYMSCFGGVFQLLESEQIPSEHRREIASHLPLSVPQAIIDIQEYLVGAGEYVAKKFEDLEVLREVPERIGPILRDTMLEGTARAIQSTMPYMIYAALTTRCMEKFIGAGFSTKSSLLDFATIFQPQ